MATDNWKEITGRTYDHRNLPLTMKKKGGCTVFENKLKMY